MLSSRSVTNFFGHGTSEVMPGNLTPMAVNPATDVYLLREAMWRQASADLASPAGVLGQPTKAAMSVRRGDLLFADASMQSTIDYALMGASMPIVFNTLLGLSFVLKLRGDEYRLMHNGSLTRAETPTVAIPAAETQRLLTAMLRERYDDLRFVGIAMSDWVVDDQRQSNAGIAAAASGTIATLNSTGHSVGSGMLLCLRMPQWGDQYVEQAGGGGGGAPVVYNRYPDGEPDTFDQSGATRIWLARPRLQLYYMPKQAVLGGGRDQVLTTIRSAITAIRVQVQAAGTIFGRRMNLVGVSVRDEMFRDAPGATDSQAAIDSAVAAVAEFAAFNGHWAAINAQIDDLVAAAGSMALSDLHDAYLCVLTELLRIHAAVWGAVNDAEGGSFFETDQRFSDHLQAVRRELLRLEGLHGLPGSILFTSADDAAARAATEEAIVAEGDVTPNMHTTIILITLDEIAPRADAAADDLVTAMIDLQDLVKDTPGLAGADPTPGPTVSLAGATMADDAYRAMIAAFEILTPLDNTLNSIFASMKLGDAGYAEAEEIVDEIRAIVARYETLKLASEQAPGGNRGDTNVPVNAKEDKGPALAEIVRLRNAAEVVSPYYVATATLRVAQRARAVANAANAEAALPARTEENMRLVEAVAAAGIPAAEKTAQTHMIAARANDINALTARIRIADNRAAFTANFRAIVADADARLHGLIAPWDKLMTDTVTRVRRLIYALGSAFTNTSHYDLLFDGQPFDATVIPDAGVRARVAAQTLPRLDFAVDMDPFLQEWGSLDRSTRGLRDIIHLLDTNAQNIAHSPYPRDNLILDPDNPVHVVTIREAVRDSVYLYMLYNNSIHASADVAARYASHFVLWSNRAGLSPARGPWPANYQTKKWHELPLFKVVEGAEANGLMRVTMIA